MARKPNPRICITRAQKKALVLAGFSEYQVRGWFYKIRGPFPCDYPEIERAIGQPLVFVAEVEDPESPQPAGGRVVPREYLLEPQGDGFCWISFDAWAADGLTKDQVCEACVKQLGTCRKAEAVS